MNWILTSIYASIRWSQNWIYASDFLALAAKRQVSLSTIFAEESAAMKLVDEDCLESDLAYRFSYLSEFMGFAADDVAMIHAAAPAIAPLVPALVDAVYDKLQAYDATWRHFLPRHFGYEGALPEGLENLGQDHELIQYRKQHLARYLAALVTRAYDGTMVEYLDMVGKMHTPHAGSTEIDVPLVQMNALLGFVSDALVVSILGLGLDRQREAATLRAFNKFLWLQNDLINRHYAATAGKRPHTERRVARRNRAAAAIG
jgi:hypothetical protein